MAAGKVVARAPRPELSAGAIASAVAAGSLTAADAVDAALARLARLDPTTALRTGRDPTGLAVAAPLVADPADLTGWATIVLGPLPPSPPPRHAAFSPDLGFATDLDAEVVTLARNAAGRLGVPLVDVPVRLRDPADAWTAARAGDPSARGINDAALAALFGQVDLLLTPTTPGPPHGRGGPGDRMNVALTWAFNLSGHPALSLPAGTTAAGAPVGLQVVGQPGSDAALLPIATITAW